MDKSIEVLQYMAQLISKAIEDYKGLRYEDMEFEHLRGLTNLVYKVSPKDPKSKAKPVICRKFNLNHPFINRDHERKLFKELGEKGCGPKCLYDDGQHRIEEFIDSRVILGQEYNKKPQYIKMVAREIARFHKIKVDWLPKARYLPEDLSNQTKMKTFLEKCDKSEVFTEEEFQKVQALKKVASEEEREFLTKMIPNDDFVLSHNDLSNGNILVTPDEKAVVLVDYEYAGINFRGFDLGYIFHQARVERIDEHPYFKLVDQNFLTDQNLELFLKHYICFSDMPNELHYTDGQALIESEQAFEKYMAEKYQVSELYSRYQNLKKQAYLGVLACCHYIITWATGMAKSGGNFKFGHLEFAEGGYEYYMKYKENLKKLLAE